MRKNMQQLECLLEIGRESKERKDQKSYVTVEDIQFLITQGAWIENMNYQQIGGRYVHTVVWRNEFWYITTTEERVAFTKP